MRALLTFLSSLLPLAILTVIGLSSLNAQTYLQGPDPDETRVVLMDAHRFEGGKTEYITGNRRIANTKEIGMLDNIESIIVPRGKKVTIYDHLGFSTVGAWAVLYPGRYPALGRLKNRTASLIVEDFDDTIPLVWLFEHDDLSSRWQITQSFAAGSGEAGDTDMNALLCDNCFTTALVPKGVELYLFEHPKKEERLGNKAAEFQGYSNRLPFENQDSRTFAEFDLRNHNLNDVVSGVRVINQSLLLTRADWEYVATISSDLKAAKFTAAAAEANVSGSTASVAVEGRYTESVSRSKETSSTLTAGVQVTVKPGALVKAVVDVEKTFSYSFAQNFKQGSSTGTSNTDVIRHSVNVPIFEGCNTFVDLIVIPEMRRYKVTNYYTRLDQNGEPMSGVPPMTSEHEVDVKQVSTSKIKVRKECNDGSTDELGELAADSESIDATSLTPSNDPDRPATGGQTPISSSTGDDAGSEPFSVDYEDEDGEVFRCTINPTANGRYRETDPDGDEVDAYTTDRTEGSRVYVTSVYDQERYVFDFADDSVYHLVGGDWVYIGDIVR